MWFVLQLSPHLLVDWNTVCATTQSTPIGGLECGLCYNSVHTYWWIGMWFVLQLSPHLLVDWNVVCATTQSTPIGGLECGLYYNSVHTYWWIGIRFVTGTEQIRM